MSFTVPEDIRYTLQERRRVWQEFDRAREVAKQLEQKGECLACTGTPASLSSLTSSPTPENEVRATLSALTDELDRISRAESRITELEGEITIIRSKEHNRLMLLVGAGLALLAIVVVGLVIVAW